MVACKQTGAVCMAFNDQAEREVVKGVTGRMGLYSPEVF